MEGDKRADLREKANTNLIKIIISYLWKGKLILLEHTTQGMLYSLMLQFIQLTLFCMYCEVGIFHPVLYCLEIQTGLLRFSTESSWTHLFSKLSTSMKYTPGHTVSKDNDHNKCRFFATPGCPTAWLAALGLLVMIRCELHVNTHYNFPSLGCSSVGLQP